MVRWACDRTVELEVCVCAVTEVPRMMAGDQPDLNSLRCNCGGEPGEPPCALLGDPPILARALFLLRFRRADLPVMVAVVVGWGGDFFSGEGDRGTALPNAGRCTIRFGTCLLYTWGLT